MGYSTESAKARVGLSLVAAAYKGSVDRATLGKAGGVVCPITMKEMAAMAGTVAHASQRTGRVFQTGVEGFGLGNFMAVSPFQFR